MKVLRDQPSFNMAGPETQKSPQEQPKNPPKGDIVSEAVESGRKTIGEYDKDVHDEGEWDEQKIQKRMNDKLSKHEHLSLLETYDFNADTDRMQALRLIAKAQDEKRELTGGEESEVIAAQIRVTVLENLSKAADAYVDMMDLYRSYKAQGLKPELKEEEVALQHSALVNSVAEKRVGITEKMLLGQLNAQERAALQQEALKTDRELLRLLAAEDQDVPGGNKEGILPVHRLILSVLNNEYRDIMDDYQDAASKDFSKRKERADKANVRLHEAFPGKDDSQISEADQDRVLSQIEDGYTMHEYHNDLLVLRRDAVTFNVLKERGKKNIERLAELNTIMGRYQIHRAELSSIRHHFDQGYEANQKQSPLPGTTNPEAIKASREFLDSQQTGAVGSLEKHLERVDTGVLKVGVAEKTETLWNERGRPFVAKLADRIATLETAWMPNVPWLPDSYLQNGTRDYLLGGLYDALGWPRDEKGMPKKQEDLTPSEFTAIKEKQKSIEKVIDQFREKGSFEKVRKSVAVAKILVNRKDLLSQNFLDTAGEIDTASLPQEALTPENMDELIREHGAPIVYKMCYVQLRDNWEVYSKDYTQLLTDFHETIGVHYDFQRHYTDFAKSQMDIAKLLALVALGGIVVGAVGALAVWKLTKSGLRIAGKTLQGGARLTGKTIQKGAELTAKSARGVRDILSKASEGAAKTEGAVAPAAKGASAAEKAAEGAARTSKIGRVLGPIAIVLSALDLRRVIQRDARLEELREYDGVQAAIELLETKGNKQAYRLNAELGYLRNRLETMVVIDGSEKLLHELEKRFPTSENNERAEALKTRCEALMKEAKSQKEEYNKLFPITDYLVTDPQRPAGNVGVNIRNIDEARARGMQYEKEKDTGFSLSEYFKKPQKPKVESGQKLTAEQTQKILEEFAKGIESRTPFQKLKADYEQLLSDGADFLETP